MPVSPMYQTSGLEEMPVPSRARNHGLQRRLVRWPIVGADDTPEVAAPAEPSRFLPDQVSLLAADHPERETIAVERVQRFHGTGKGGQPVQMVLPIMAVKHSLGPGGVGSEEVGKRVPHGAAHPGLGLFESPRLAPQIEKGKPQALVDDLPALDQRVIPVEQDGTWLSHLFVRPPRQWVR